MLQHPHVMSRESEIPESFSVGGGGVRGGHASAGKVMG